MNQEIRNKLRNVVTQCRKLLEESVSQELEGKYGIFAKKDQVTADPNAPMLHLTEEEQAARKDILDHFAHIKARGFKPKDALDQLVREIAFTHLNRLCAYKMMEARGVYINGQKFREAVSRGIDSNGLKFYLADHPEDERLFNTGHQDIAYRHFLDWLGGLLSEEIGVLFNPNDPANRLYPRQKTLDEVLDLLNNGGIKPEESELREAWPKIWTQDETIGWVYQYFTPKELRDAARDPKKGGSLAPRNSYELAFRNQFFTPRYVVEFLTDNTLGRIWYEMRMGQTKLVERCEYFVRRSHPVFLFPGQEPPKPFICGEWEGGMEAKEVWTCPPRDNVDLQTVWQYALTLDGYEVSKVQYGRECGDLSNERIEEYRQTKKWRGSFEELRCCLFFEQRRWRHFGYDPEGEDLTAILELFSAVCERWNFETEFIPHRPKRDPRELRILDPACGSGHFLLYCFDLLLTIYEEAYSDPDLAPALHENYPTLEALQRDVPRLILAHNVHGIDIDLRCSQIAALALWLRCQRTYQEMGLKKDRPKITRSHLVCAEPMPGEEQMLKEFVNELEPKLLGQVVEVVFDKMKLAGEAGSLLKLEEEIRDAVSSAKKQWVREMSQATDRKGQPLLFTQAEIDRIHQRPEQTSLFDVSDITNEHFFERAESEVIKALRRYAEESHGVQQLPRRLFTEDAVRGFAFVDVLQKRYDVALMNPPFGVPSRPSQDYLKRNFPQSKNDLFATFVERGLALLADGGRLGAITSRTGCFLTSFSKWREEIVLKQSQPRALADLGGGVLDTALVETAAYCLEKTANSNASASIASPFFRLLTETNKESQLRDAITGLRTCPAFRTSGTYLASPDSFRHLPGSPFSYWASEAIRNLFRSLPTFDDESHGRSTRCGLGTLDDFRFIRLRWEIEADQIGTNWRVYYHGGVYSPFHDEFPCVVLWTDNGAGIKKYVEDKVGSASRKVQGEGSYFKPGFVFPRRTKGFAPKFMPEGGIFSTAGQAGFVPLDDLAWTIALLSSRICTFLLSLSQGRTGDAAQFEVGLVKRLPWPQPDDSIRRELGSLALSAFQITLALHSHQESSHFFLIPPAIRCKGITLAERHRDWQEQIDTNRRALFTLQQRINEIALKLYRVSEVDISPLARSEDSESESYTDSEVLDENDGPAEVVTVTEEPSDPTNFVRSLISYYVGCLLGVWDVRKASEESDASSCISPIDPLPQSSPGCFRPGHALQSGEGTRHIASDGILVDDAGHPDDVVGRVRDVAELIFENRSEVIERETSDMLGVKELREYFRKPGKSGFWDDHISRYSKSRRKAPIYWLLQSSKKNYAILLYYHRLDKDLLFKALVNYVEPKIRLESNRLVTMRDERAAAGDSGKEAKRLAIDVERQEDLLSELRDFEDKLRRAANLHLEPDLSDGVVLNIAPLHELVPWKESKSYWDELLEGKYEWSSIGKQLRQKGLVK